MIVILVISLKLKDSDNRKDKTRTFLFCPEKEIGHQDKISNHIKDKKPNIYTQNKKLICNWTDKKNYLIHYKMLKLYVRHGMVVHEVISYRRNKWLEKYIHFNTEKRSRATSDFEKKFL